VQPHGRQRSGWCATRSEGLVARDTLTLTTINTPLHPVPAIQAWQDEINPRTHPELLEDGAN